MPKYAAIDFEYNNSSEPLLNLVSCAIKLSSDAVSSYWLYHDDLVKQKLVTVINKLHDAGYVFVAWNVVAEAQSFISLGLKPENYKWIDVQIEWKMLTNHSHKWAYGQQYMDGKIVTTVPPKYGDNKDVNNLKAKTNLASGLWKLLGFSVDTDHKDKIRDIIIRADKTEISSNIKPILEYNVSDVHHLIPAWKRIAKEYEEYFKHRDTQVTWDEVFFRGDTAARTAKMMSLGYPINYKSTRKFKDSVPTILKEMCEDINSQFPKEEQFFKWNNKEQRYSVNRKVLQEWVKQSKYVSKWISSGTSGEPSLSIKAWEKHFNYSHSFPRCQLPAQYIRYLKLLQSLNGFKRSKKDFFDRVGTDERVRAYLNPYGSQSARYQPGATHFIPLKSAWMRSLIQANPGRSIASIDYGSEEFLIAAYLSHDTNMINAYKSGDVYLAFAKLVGAVPQDGTKKTHKKERDLFKSTTLGISYNMGPNALANKISADTGEPCSVEKAKDLIAKFKKAYPKYAKYQEDVYYTYLRKKYWKLSDGWTMFGDNDNERSVKNLPVQGLGSCILRQAIKLAQDRGLDVIYPLHDAVYIEYNSHDYNSLVVLETCMREAFGYFFPDYGGAGDVVRLDCDSWSPDYVLDELTTTSGLNVKTHNIYIDERSADEYDRFKQYM